MQQNKFAELVTQIKMLGITGHQIYEIANQIDSSVTNYATAGEIKAIAEQLVREEKQCDEADYYEE